MPAIPLPPPFTSAPLPLGMGGADDGQNLGPPIELISASEMGERGDEPMDVDTWAGVPPDVEEGSSVEPDVECKVESQIVESTPVA